MRFRFTEREIEQALDKLVILIDSREQDANKYKSIWDREQVKYYSKEEFVKYNKVDKVAKKDLFEPNLPSGDYSCMLPKGTLKGIDRAIWFDKVTIVEKKKNINEIAGNLKVTNGEYKRLTNEFARLKANGTRHRILVEDALFFKHLYKGTGDQRHGWKNQDSLVGAVDKALSDWGTELIPIDAEFMPRKIYSILRNDARAYLREFFKLDNLENVLGEEYGQAT